MPESDEGISKLKMLETVEVTLPLNEVPAAVLGDEESMGIIRCGNSKLPEERAVPQLVAGGGVVPLEHELACNSIISQLLRSLLWVV